MDVIRGLRTQVVNATFTNIEENFLQPLVSDITTQLNIAGKCDVVVQEIDTIVALVRSMVFCVLFDVLSG